MVGRQTEERAVVTEEGLRVEHAGHTDIIPLDSPAWFAWLADPAHTSFRLPTPAGPLTIRKEPRRRGAGYWVAYRRVHGRLRKHYLGPAPALTAARLALAAAALADAPSPAPAPAEPPLLVTKLALPPAPLALAPRPRLTALLLAAPRPLLTLVVAPAGFGKTSLLRAVAPLLGDVAGLALDPADSDPSLFWSYLLAALTPQLPPDHRPRLALARLPPDQLADAVLAPLVAALAARARPLTLLLDDYHAIDHPLVHAGLARLLDHAPATLRLVIASRTRPPLPLARLRARGQLRELDAAALRFTAGEAAALLEGALGAALPDGEVAALVDHTAGWAAGLRLVALALAAGEPAAAVLAGMSGAARDIVAYLLAEVWERQDATVQAFLRQTAVLSRLSGPLCDAVLASAPGTSAALLRRLEAGGLFLSALDGAGVWYGYHPLFRAFLERQLAEAGSAEARTVHRRAAAWLAAHGDLPEAMRHLVAAGDPHAAVQLLEQHYPPLLWTQAAFQYLNACVRMLPAEVVRDQPQIGLLRAWSLFGARQFATAVPAALEAALGAVPDGPAKAAWEAGHPPPEGTDPGTHTVLAEASLITLYLDMLARYGAAGGRLARRARAWVPQTGPDQLMLRIQEASAALGRGDLAAAEELFQATLAESRRYNSEVLALMSLSELGYIAELRGQLRASRARYAEALRAAEDAQALHLLFVYMPALHLAGLEYERGELAAACPRIDAALPDLRVQWFPFTHLPLLLTVVRVFVAAGQPARAQAELDHAAALAAVDDPVGLAVLALLAARCRLLQGLPLAPADLGLAAPDPLAPRRAYAAATVDVRALADLCLARVLLARARPDAALALLDDVLGAAAAQGRAQAVREALVVRAQALLAQGERAAARDALARALTMGESGESTALLAEADPGVRALLPDLRGQGGRVGATAAALLAALGAAADADATALSERERAVLALLAAGRANREIAQTLVLAESTVKWHVSNILAKLHARSRLEAVAAARARGLIELPRTSEAS